jgi:hypothetical protein
MQRKTTSRELDRSDAGLRRVEGDLDVSAVTFGRTRALRDAKEKRTGDQGEG